MAAILLNLFKSGKKINLKEMPPEEGVCLTFHISPIRNKAYPNLKFDLVTELKSSPIIL